MKKVNDNKRLTEICGKEEEEEGNVSLSCQLQHIRELCFMITGDGLIDWIDTSEG